MHLYFTSSHVFALFEHSKIWDPGDGVRNLFFSPPLYCLGFHVRLCIGLRRFSGRLQLPAVSCIVSITLMYIHYTLLLPTTRQGLGVLGLIRHDLTLDHDCCTRFINSSSKPTLPLPTIYFFARYIQTRKWEPWNYKYMPSLLMSRIFLSIQSLSLSCRAVPCATSLVLPPRPFHITSHHVTSRHIAPHRIACEPLAAPLPHLPTP
jgi:hypothetical protein